MTFLEANIFPKNPHISQPHAYYISDDYSIGRRNKMARRLPLAGTYSTAQAAEMIVTTLGEPERFYAYCKRLTNMAKLRKIKTVKNGANDKYYNYDTEAIKELCDQLYEVKYGRKLGDTNKNVSLVPGQLPDNVHHIPNINEKSIPEKYITVTEIKELIQDLCELGVEDSKIVSLLKKKLKI
jgi:hypothetical protein